MALFATWVRGGAPPAEGASPPRPAEAVLDRRICEAALPLALPAGGASPPGPPEKDVGSGLALVVMPPLLKTGMSYMRACEELRGNLGGTYRGRQSMRANNPTGLASHAGRVLGKPGTGFPNQGRGGEAPRNA